MRVVNTYVPGIAAYSHTNASLMAVLTQDEAGLYAAYIGIVPETVQHSPERERYAEWIAHNGTKVRFAKVADYFTGITDKQYRH
jgi:hypothetical protein